MRTEKTIHASDIWNEFETSIWEIKNIIPDESFYPVYRWKNFASFSPLKLLEMKESVAVNPQLKQYLHDGTVDTYLPPHVAIDAEIERIGGPNIPRRFTIKTQTQFIEKIAHSLISDARAIEKRHPNATVFIYVGGKDSLNLLLIPWRNRVVALSGEPNYPLVVEFCTKNGIGSEVIKLGEETSDSDDMLEKECLVNCCRTGLAHIRWSQSVLKIINSEPFSSSPCVLITGALGDVFLTPFFKKYRSQWPWPGSNESFLQKVLRKTIPATQTTRINSKYHTEMWQRGAQWQGVFHGIIRESIGIPNYSGYHGRSVLDSLTSTDLTRVVTSDLRPEIGRSIWGRDVDYPSSNPSPTAWHTRDRFSTVGKWLEIVRNSTNMKIS